LSFLASQLQDPQSTYSELLQSTSFQQTNKQQQTQDRISQRNNNNHKTEVQKATTTKQKTKLQQKKKPNKKKKKEEEEEVEEESVWDSILLAQTICFNSSCNTSPTTLLKISRASFIPSFHECLHNQHPWKEDLKKKKQEVKGLKL
jgi:hypothetical protein